MSRSRKTPCPQEKVIAPPITSVILPARVVTGYGCWKALAIAFSQEPPLAVHIVQGGESGESQGFSISPLI